MGHGIIAPRRKSSADATSANLTPASGRQDHTTSPYAASSLVRVLLTAHRFKEPAPQSHRAQNAAASTASLPYVRDDRDTPLWWGGMAKVLEVIWGGRKQKYFCERDWTAQIRLKSHDKSPGRRTAIWLARRR